MKKEISAEDGLKLVNHGPTVLVSCGKEDNPNIITLAWVTVCSHNPPLIAISISPKRYSHSIIEENKEFVINIPNADLLKEIWLCGTKSGRNVDKFKIAKLTKVKTKKINTVYIDECIGNVECVVYKKVNTGDHTLFIGKIVSSYVEEDIFDGHLIPDKKKAQTVHHLGGRYFGILTRRVEV